MKGEGLKGCGRGRATDGGGLRAGVGALFWVGCPGDGNCCVEVTTVPFLTGGVTTLDGTAAAAIGAVLDVCMGVGVVVLICPGEGCCGDGLDGVEPFTIGVVLAALAVATVPAAAVAATAAGACAGGSCPCCSCGCGCCA